MTNLNVVFMTLNKTCLNPQRIIHDITKMSMSLTVATEINVILAGILITHIGNRSLFCYIGIKHTRYME